MRAGVDAGPMRSSPPGRASGLRAFLADGAPRRHGLDGGDAGAARRSARRCGRRCARSSCSASTTARDDDPLAILAARSRGAISVYAQGDDYHDVIKKRLKSLARWLIAHGRRRGEGVRRHRGGDGKAAGRSGRARLAGQAHQPGVARSSAPGCFSARSSPRSSCRRDAAEARPLRRLPRLPRHLPDGGVPGALPARRAALHLLPHHRAQGPDPARAARRRSATASTAATIASRSARGTSSRARAARRSSRARDDLRAPALAELARLDDAAFRACFARTPVKRIGRDRFVRNVLIAIGNCGDAALAPEAARLLADAAPLVRGAAVWALSRLLPGDEFAALAARAAANEQDAAVLEEWALATPDRITTIR